MDVSIVTPVLNEPRLASTIESIRDQETTATIELLVVDGGSGDETTDVLNEYDSDIDVLVREPDEGLYDAMNKGIERASGDIVGILNADDRYEGPEVIQSVVDALNATGADSCYGDLVYVTEADDVVRYWKGGEYHPRKFYFGWMPPHPTFYVRRAVYEQFGTYDLAYSIAADYELMLRFLLRHGISTTYLDRLLVRMTTGGTSNASVRNVLTANREVYRAWRDNGLRGGGLAPVLKPLRKVSQFVTWRGRTGPDGAGARRRVSERFER